MSKALVLGAVALALSAGAASAQAPNIPVYPGAGYAPYGSGYAPYGYGYATTAPLYDYAAPGYGYAGYGYAAPGYAAPTTAGTTVIIVTPGAPAYAAPPVVGSGYYNYARGYGGWRAGYWGGYGYGWR